MAKSKTPAVGGDTSLPPVPGATATATAAKPASPIAIAPAKKPGLTYGGVDITSPGAAEAISPKDGIDGYVKAAQAANNANDLRYNQGLGVLVNGANQADEALKNYGAGEKETLATNLQQNNAGSIQSAIGRGIANTSVLDSLQRGNARTYNTGLNDLANRQASIAASNAQANAASISGAIFGRNDVTPDLAAYANAIQQAASGGGAVLGTSGGVSGIIHSPTTGSLALTPWTSSFGGGGGGGGGGAYYGASSGPAAGYDIKDQVSSGGGKTVEVSGPGGFSGTFQAPSNPYNVQGPGGGSSTMATTQPAKSSGGAAPTTQPSEDDGSDYYFDDE